MKHSSFTLVELMIVLAILALLAGIVIFVVKPGNILDQVKDYQRVSDLNNISKSINYLNTIQLGLLNLGSSTTIYVSLPDNTSTTCSSYALPSLPTGYTYSCQNSTNYQKNDSTGWIPINFKETDNSNILSTLPKDPVNNITYYYTYFPGGSFELTAQLTTPRDTSINDNGQSGLLYETGSPNHINNPIIRDSRLVSYWTFNEGTGTSVFDYSGHGYTSTFNGTGTKWATVTGTGESVGVFNGTSDSVSTPTYAVPKINEELTMSVWVNWALLATTQSVWSDAGSTSFRLYRASNSNDIWWIYSKGSGTGSFTATNFCLNYDNTWTLITIVLDYGDKNAKFYRNGIIFDTYTTSNTMVFPEVSVYKTIGNYVGNPSRFLGYIDDFRLYNRALSAEEILSMYNLKKARYGL